MNGQEVYPIKLTLLAALCWSRAAEITDSLVDLFLALVHKMDVRAERQVESELVADLKRVRGKSTITGAWRVLLARKDALKKCGRLRSRCSPSADTRGPSRRI